MSDVVILVENLCKLYRLGEKADHPDTFAGAVASYLKAPVKNLMHLRKLTRFNLSENSEDVLWALRDVSFDVKRGEVVGIIGRNGAGKSTLLKILSRITEPTRGRIVLRGRVGSLLEVGTGFHPELTGRENIYMNGTILGMTKTEIHRKFDEIVDFSGVEKFLDTPVKRYSSGMNVRLAFAVAAHLDPEILIVDEVLAVGDTEFQKKCLGKMEAVSQQGRTVLFVSHDLPAIKRLCSRGILLDKGAVAVDTSTEETLRYYAKQAESFTRIALRERTDRTGNGNFRFVKRWIEDETGRRSDSVAAGSKVTFVLEYEVDTKSSIRILEEIAILILTPDGRPLIEFASHYVGKQIEVKGVERGRLRCAIDRFPLNAGEYSYHLWAKSALGREDIVMDAGRFTVAVGDYFGTGKMPSPEWLFLTDQSWEHIPLNEGNVE